MAGGGGREVCEWSYIMFSLTPTQHVPSCLVFFVLCVLSYFSFHRDYYYPKTGNNCNDGPIGTSTNLAAKSHLLDDNWYIWLFMRRTLSVTRCKYAQG